jgi:hypothetical protein
MFKKFLIFVETWGLTFLVALLGGSFVLAVRELLQADPAPAMLEAIIQVAKSDADSAEGWTGHMHLLLNVTLAWAAVRVYMATAGLKWDHFSARWLVRSHVVIVAGRPDAEATNSPGMPDKTALALELALAIAPGERVVLALPDIDEGQRSRLWQAGVRVITDRLPSDQLLTATGASRARMLIAMRDDYGQNIALTHAAVSPSTDNPQMEIKCLIEPLSVRREFKLEDYFDERARPQIRVFSEPELVARRLVQSFPPDAPLAQSESEGVHVIIVGLGSVGQSILVQLARQGHYRSGKKPKVTVVDRSVGDRWREAREAYPALERWLQVEKEETRFEAVGPQQIQKWLTDERPVTVAYVCTKDEIVNLRIARMLLEGIKEQPRQDLAGAAKVVALDPAGGCVLADFAAHGGHEGRFQLFSLVRGSEGFLSEMDDTRARQFHDDYCASDNERVRKQPGAAPAPANKPWEQLPETLRNANRMTADHFDVKMRAIGCHVVPRGEVEGKHATLTPQEIELLSIMEHNRWWADRALDGWTLGPRKDANKVHPNMVPYEELDEEAKQKDRNFVLHMIKVLENEGLLVVRDTPT